MTGRVWKGTAFGGYKSRDSVPQLVEDYMKGEIDADAFITHHFDFEDINQSFEALKVSPCSLFAIFYESITVMLETTCISNIQTALDNLSSHIC